MLFNGYHMIIMIQVQAYIKMAAYDLLEETVRGKDEWRFATMACGAQCVQSVGGMKPLQILSVGN